MVSEDQDEEENEYSNEDENEEMYGEVDLEGKLVCVLQRKNPPSDIKKTSLAEEQFSLCEIRSTQPLQG